MEMNDPQWEGGGYVTVGVNGQVRGSGVGSPAWAVLLPTSPRNRPGNKDDAAAEAAWRAATVDYEYSGSAVARSGTFDDDDAGAGAGAGAGAAAAAENAAAVEKLKDIRAEGAARPIGTTLELPAEGPTAEAGVAHY